MIDDKVDKVDGKGLSTNDFTNAYKEKLDNIGASGMVESDPTVPDWAKEPTKPTYSTDELIEGVETWIFYAGNARDLIDPLAPQLVENEAGGYTAEIG